MISILQGSLRRVHAYRPTSSNGLVCCHRLQKRVSSGVTLVTFWKWIMKDMLAYWFLLYSKLDEKMKPTLAQHTLLYFLQPWHCIVSDLAFRWTPSCDCVPHCWDIFWSVYLPYFFLLFVAGNLNAVLWYIDDKAIVFADFFHPKHFFLGGQHCVAYTLLVF